MQHGPRLPSAYKAGAFLFFSQIAEKSLKTLVNVPILFICDSDQKDKDSLENDTKSGFRGMPGACKDNGNMGQMTSPARTRTHSRHIRID